MKKRVTAISLICLVAGVAVWFWSQRPASRQSLADISGHWEGPSGGLWFDASASYFKLDIMHAFFYGHWKATDANHCELQFYDLFGEEPVLDRADLRGGATLDRTGPKTAVLISWPDGTSMRFTYLNPPDEDILEMEQDMKNALAR